MHKIIFNCDLCENEIQTGYTIKYSPVNGNSSVLKHSLSAIKYGLFPISTADKQSRKMKVKHVCNDCVIFIFIEGKRKREKSKQQG